MTTARRWHERSGVGFIKSRLRRIESASRAVARCPGCRLRTQDRDYIVVDGKDPAPEVPEVCPECGRSTRLYIQVVYEGEGA